MDVTSCGLTNVNRGVRLIALQFSFSNPDAVPECVRQLAPETVNGAQQRKNLANGELVISPVENVELVPFLYELETNGYRLVDAVYEPRRHQYYRNTVYHMVRFVFAQPDHIRESEPFEPQRAAMRQALYLMCEQALWRTRVFLNPLYINGEEVVEGSAVSINLEVRRPRYDHLGNLIKVWRQDQAGKRVGVCPIPIQPDYALTFTADEIRLKSLPPLAG